MLLNSVLDTVPGECCWGKGPELGIGLLAGTVTAARSPGSEELRG